MTPPAAGSAQTPSFRCRHIANEKRDRLELPAQVVSGLGHGVIARETYVTEVGAVTAPERPDVALVELGPAFRTCTGRGQKLLVRPE